MTSTLKKEKDQAAQEAANAAATAAAAQAKAIPTCWTAIDNDRIFGAGNIEDKHIMDQAGWSSTGDFLVDFAKNATKLGITPHPHIRAEKKIAIKEEKEEENDKDKEKQDGTVSPNTARNGNGTISPNPSATTTATTAATATGTPTTTAPSPAATAAATAAAKKSKRERDAEAIRTISLTGWICDRGTAAAMAVSIPACKTLQTIKFWNASLSAASINLLASCLPYATIQKLYLDFNPVVEDTTPSAFASLLTTSSCLQLLSLRGNHMSDIQGASVLRALSENRTLQSLDLWNNSLGVESCTAARDALLLNSTLMILNLSKNAIDDTAAIRLAESMVAVVVENREEIKRLKKDGYRLSNFKNKFWRDTNAGLRHLYLSSNHLTDDGVNEWIHVLSPGASSSMAVSTPKDGHRELKEVKKEGTKEVNKLMSRLEKVFLSDNPYSLTMHQRLLTHDKIVVDESYHGSSETRSTIIQLTPPTPVPAAASPSVSVSASASVSVSVSPTPGATSSTTSSRSRTRSPPAAGLGPRSDSAAGYDHDDSSEDIDATLDATLDATMEE